MLDSVQVGLDIRAQHNLRVRLRSLNPRGSRGGGKGQIQALHESQDIK